MKVQILRFIAFFAVCGGLLIFHACTEESTTEDCSISISNFTVSPTTFAPGANITGTVTFTDKVGLDNLTARNVTELYLSTDATYSSSDTQLDSFTDPAALSGTTYTINFNQIDIPFGIAAGSYQIIARIGSQNCGGGLSSDAATRSKAVTIN